MTFFGPPSLGVSWFTHLRSEDPSFPNPLPPSDRVRLGCPLAVERSEGRGNGSGLGETPLLLKKDFLY